MNNGQSSLVANAESIPANTSEVIALDQSEKEYNRMISQHTTYHRMMMDDLMKLSTESGSMNSSQPMDPIDKMSIVSGLGTTIKNLDASNEQLLKTAAKYVDQGKQRAITAANLNAYMKETGLKLQNDIKAYDEISKKEGFSNPTMDAALEMSEIMSESQKYALVIFGAFAMFLLYKTIKNLQ
jgi:hypothetical protein